MTSDRLLTLGFFRDECSDTMQMYMSKPTQKEYVQGHMTPEERQSYSIRGTGRRGPRENAGDSATLVVVLLIVSAISVGLTTYMCCRNRCKKRSSSDLNLNGGPQIHVTDIDKTPARAAPSGFLGISEDDPRF